MDEDLIARAFAILAASITAATRTDKHRTALKDEPQFVMGIAAQYFDYIDPFAADENKFNFTLQGKK